MKHSRLVFALALVFICHLCPLAFAADGPAPADSEVFETKVLKVFVAKDGPAIFRAYLVSWKGQEVIASDPLAHSNFKEGDTISVLAMNHPYPQDQEPYRLLGFMVVR